MGKHQPKELYKRPLTPEEARFAEDHLSLVYWFLNKQGLNENEWFDVVIFRYLLSVKKYVSIPNLQQYSFTNMAYRAMASAITNERQSQKIRIQTVSLYDTLPGTDNLAYADMITMENLNFVPYTEGVEDVKITYNVSLPNINKKKCEETIAIEKFLAGNAENMCLEYDTAKEADLRAKSIRGHRDRLARHHIYYQAHLVKNRIYITKGKEVAAK